MKTEYSGKNYKLTEMLSRYRIYCKVKNGIIKRKRRKIMYNDVFDTFPVLETERLLLRQLKISDIDDFHEYAKDRDAFFFTDGFPHEYDELQHMISIWNNEAYSSKQFIRWGIELKSDKKIIGGIYLFSPTGDDIAGRRMDMGYEISRKYWNKGYATEAIRAVVECCLKIMELKRVQALIIPENVASIRACEKAGFVNEGTLRNYCHYQHNGNCLRTMVVMACIPSDLGL